MKLSTALEALINAKHFRPVPTLSPLEIQDLFCKMENEATEKGLKLWSWLTVSTATVMTLNSPESMIILFQYATAPRSLDESVTIAEFMREIGLRCMGINGLPRTLNMLYAFRAALPPAVVALLNTTPIRYLSASNVDTTKVAGRILWGQIHGSTGTNVEYKLKAAHPDLSAFAIDHVYGGLFTDRETVAGAKLGRVNMSLFAIACLRVQRGAEAQLRGHVLGLRKVWEDDAWRSGLHADTQDATRWLVSDEGCAWVLGKIDGLVEALGEKPRTAFAPVKAKI